MKNSDYESLVAEKVAGIAQSIIHLNSESGMCFFMTIHPHTKKLRIVCTKSKEDYDAVVWLKEESYDTDKRCDTGPEVSEVMSRLTNLKEMLDGKIKQYRELR